MGGPCLSRCRYFSINYLSSEEMYPDSSLRDELSPHSSSVLLLCVIFSTLAFFTSSNILLILSTSSSSAPYILCFLNTTESPAVSIHEVPPPVLLLPPEFNNTNLASHPRISRDCPTFSAYSIPLPACFK
jgi:hypothetical protein